jgi:hypothetical protein
VTALGLTTVGCLNGNGRAGGGGWIPSVVSGEKATFGFHAKCEDGIGKASLSFKDHGVDVSFKVAQLTLDETTHANTICGVASLDAFTDGADFVGTYTPQPASAGDGGLVFVGYTDNGLPGQSNEDQMGVALQGGIYNGYVNVQFLSQGQVNISPE